MADNAQHHRDARQFVPFMPDTDSVRDVLSWLTESLYLGMHIEIAAIKRGLDAAADPPDTAAADPQGISDDMTVPEAQAALKICTALQNGIMKIIEWLQQDSTNGPDRAAEGAAALLKLIRDPQRDFRNGLPRQETAPHFAHALKVVMTVLITISNKPWAVEQRKAAEARAWAEVSGYRPPQERVQSNHLVMQYLPTLPLAEFGTHNEPTPIHAHSKGYILPVSLRADVGQRLPKHLTVFDRHVFNSVCTLWAGGCRTFTLPQIYRVMHGRTDTGSRGNDESKEAMASILRSLRKLQSTHITIDYTQELAVLSPKTRNRLGDLVQRRECYLLPISIDTMQTPAGVEYIAVRLNSEPALLTDALARHQILRIPADVIDVHRPDGKRPRATALFHNVKEVLIAHVTVLRRRAANKPGWKKGKAAAAPPAQLIREAIRAEYLYDHLTEAGHDLKSGTPAARKLRSKARDAARTVLQHMQTTGWISGYQETVQGNSLQKWTVTFSPDLPRLPSTIPELDAPQDITSEQQKPRCRRSPLTGSDGPP